MSLSRGNIHRIRANIFPDAWPAIGDPQKFPWHQDRTGDPQTWKVQSSQALAIDFFGTLKASDQSTRDNCMKRVAVQLGIPADGPWQIELEWIDPENRLRESRQTQVDALARGARGIVAFECKFTERGGCCSQPKRITNGLNKGKRQCDGSYRLQINPTNNVLERCALTGKGIRYWEIIPELFELDASATYVPCPFAGSWFQWMRNLVLCRELARTEGVDVAFTVVYPAGLSNPVEHSIHGTGEIPQFRRPGFAIRSFTYSQLVTYALEAADECEDDLSKWENLRVWIDTKVSRIIRK